jgi:hypothetical protein
VRRADVRRVLQRNVLRRGQSGSGVWRQRDDVPQLWLDGRLLLGWRVPMRWWSRLRDRATLLERYLHL